MRIGGSTKNAWLWGAILGALVVLPPMTRLLAAPELWPLFDRVMARTLLAGAVWIPNGLLIWWCAADSRQDDRWKRWFFLGMAVLVATLTSAIWSHWVYRSPQPTLLWWASTADRSVYLGVSFAMARLLSDRAQRFRANLGHMARRERMLHEAELDRLNRQLQPHFLFNALNTIAELVHQNSARAVALIREVERLFMQMAESREQTRPLRAEVDSLLSYLAIQQERFSGRFSFGIELTPETALLPVPSLILQPLVENAIRHGLEASPQPMHLSISAEKVGADLQVRVVNTLAAEPARDTRRGAGVGLENVRARLHCLYGEAASLKLEVNASSACAAIWIDASVRPLVVEASEIVPDPAAGRDTRADLTRVQKRSTALAWAAGAWLAVGLLWMSIAVIVSLAGAMPFREAIGDGVAIVRELAGYFALTTLIIVVGSQRRIQEAKEQHLIAAQVVLAIAVLAAAAIWIASRYSMRQAQLLAAENLSVRATAIFAVAIAVNAWRWHQRWLIAEMKLWETTSAAVRAEHARRRWSLQPELVHRALAKIAVTAESDAESADRMVLTMADFMRSALRANDVREWSASEERAFFRRWDDLRRLIDGAEGTHPDGEQSTGDVLRPGDSIRAANVGELSHQHAARTA